MALKTRKKTYYVTSDNKEWDDKKSAQEHERKFNIKIKSLKCDLFLLDLLKIKMPPEFNKLPLINQVEYINEDDETWSELQTKLGECVYMCPEDIEYASEFVRTVKAYVKLFGWDGLKAINDYKL